VSALRWRIPPEGDPRVLRLRLAQTGLATVVCALVLLLAAPRDVLRIGLAALVPVAVFMAFRQWSRYQKSLAGPDNTWLDERGVHWLDAAGNEQSLPRAEIVGFRVGLEEDTLRSVPALTLYLPQSHESQPLELHPPATPEEVRRYLVQQWHLEERPADRSAPGYDRAIDVYSECHDEFQEWHLEGTPAALGEFFDALAEVADLPLAPPGVKSTRRVVLARRREPSRLSIEHDRHVRVGHDTIAGSGELLRGLAAQGRSTMADLSERDGDAKFDFVLQRHNMWTFHLHVRNN
jgi:hypothetical protein